MRPEAVLHHDAQNRPGCHHRCRLRGLVGLIAAGVLSVFAVLLIKGQYRLDGPVVLSVSETHGIHRGDVLIGGGWLIGVIAVAMLVWERPRD